MVADAGCRRRVIMFPGSGNQNENRYLDILVASLREAGVEVEDWHKDFSLQKGDVFHVHWPELIAEIGQRRGQSLRGRWMAWQFFRTIARIKKNGGKVVWTVHNLRPHKQALQSSPLQASLMRRFEPAVDAVLSMTNSGIEQIRQQMPGLKHAAFYVARHPHYRPLLGGGRYDAAARQRLGIAPEQKAMALIGTLRANKRPDLLAKAFLQLPAKEYFLLLAGAADDALAAQLRQQLAGACNVHLQLRRLTEQEVADYYAVADALIFPGQDYFNSGTIYTALSLNVPVITGESEQTRELQQLVGHDWLQLYRGEPSSERLRASLSQLANRAAGATCDLSEFAPARVAAQHMAAYAHGR